MSWLESLQDQKPNSPHGAFAKVICDLQNYDIHESVVLCLCVRIVLTDHRKSKFMRALILDN